MVIAVDARKRGTANVCGTPVEEDCMNFAARLAAMTLLIVPVFATSVHTQEAQKPPAPDGGTEVEIATNLICDTQQQVERFVAVFDGNAEAAISAVNKEANTPHACVIATAAYMKGEELTTATAGNGAGTFTVMKITIVGVLTLEGFQVVQPAEFFSLAPVGKSPETVGQRI
jgi:hypothetical protein